MRYCNRCKVKIESTFPNCPLCQKETVDIGGASSNDFSLMVMVNKKENSLDEIIKILFFVFLFLVGLNLIINYIFNFHIIWSPFSIIPLLYAYLLIKIGFKSYNEIGKIVVNNVVMLSIITIIIDNFLGFIGWSVNYVIPFLILAGIIALFLFICIRPILFVIYVVYLTVIASFGLTLIIFLVTNIITVKLPSIITIFISIMAIIAMVLFGDRGVKNELIKRFHI